jgi:hypothetical protein
MGAGLKAIALGPDCETCAFPSLSREESQRRQELEAGSSMKETAVSELSSTVYILVFLV